MNARFSAGVFMVACKKKDKTLFIKVNVRTDQERQKLLAGIEDSSVQIIDLPGGGVEVSDFSKVGNYNFSSTLKREAMEEMGCEIEILAENPVGLFLNISNLDENEKNNGDIAFLFPVRLFGEPEVSEESSEIVWISLKEFLSEEKYRCPGRLGKEGRMGKMIWEGFRYFSDKPSNYFS